MRGLLLSIGLAAGMLSCVGGTAAQSEMDSFNDVFGFGAGVLTGHEDTWGFEDNFLLALGYQKAWGDWGAMLYGFEGGLAARYGQTFSLEAWGGLFARYNFELESIRVAPAMTFGLSAATAPMAEGETYRQDDNGDGDARLLFYLGPEISFGLTEHPEYEVFARLHHRSGAWGTLGNMHGASDSLAVGLRTFF